MPTNGDFKFSLGKMFITQTNKAVIYFFLNYLPFFLGKQIGLIFCVMGTLSFSLRRAMSLSKFKKLKAPVTALKTNLDSGRLLSLQRLCSPKVTLIINHMNLKYKKLAGFKFINVIQGIILIICIVEERSTVLHREDWKHRFTNLLCNEFLIRNAVTC